MQAHPLRPSKSRIVSSSCGNLASMRFGCDGDSNSYWILPPRVVGSLRPPADPFSVRSKRFVVFAA